MPRDPRSRERGGRRAGAPARRRVAVALSLVAALGVQPLGQADPSGNLDSPAARRINTTLRLLRDPDHPPVHELAGPLEDQAGRELELLWTVLESRMVPGLDELPAQRLSEVQVELILEAVASVDGGRVDALVEERLAASNSLASRRAALELLGARSDASTLPRLFALCFPPTEEAGEAGRGGAAGSSPAAPESPTGVSEEPSLGPPAPDRELLEPLRFAVTRMLIRNASAFAALLSEQRHLHSELLAEVTRAVGDASSGEGLRFLSEVIAWHPALAASAMAQVRRIGPGPNAATNAELVDRMYGYLDAERPTECRAAALALAEFDDPSLIGDLIALLRVEDPGLRGTIHWSLTRLTGRTFSANPRLWDRWYREELRWMELERPRALQALGSMDPARVAQALGEMLPRLLVRDELVAALAQRMRGRDPAVRELITRNLAGLDHPAVDGLLLAALQDPSSFVRNAAVTALEKRSGRDLPPDPLLVLELLRDSEPSGLLARASPR